MTTIFERTQTALETLAGVPVSLAPRQGTLPDLFVVHQLIYSPPEQHADDAETLRSYLVQVTVWSRSGLVSLPNVDGAMLAAGFIKRGQRQLPKDAESGHYGLATDFVYLEGV